MHYIIRICVFNFNIIVVSAHICFPELEPRPGIVG